MTDKELLELAAKGAKCGYGEWTKHGIVFEIEDKVWNPLTDDGDALRLAVKLNIRIAGEWHSHAVAFYGLMEFHEQNTGDLYAATRRAIVRAAAAIGESM